MDAWKYIEILTEIFGIQIEATLFESVAGAWPRPGDPDLFRQRLCRDRSIVALCNIWQITAPALS
ncbi:MAG: hypothetical protein R3D29_07440 [Nitratireductor sp.]